jgi:hypothetical protein
MKKLTIIIISIFWAASFGMQAQTDMVRFLQVKENGRTTRIFMDEEAPFAIKTELNSKKQLVVNVYKGSDLVASYPEGTKIYPKSDPDPFRIYVKGSQLYRAGEPIFLVGGNTPWNKWNDFGGGFDASWWDGHFKTLHDLGVNSSRVWIVCNGDGAVKLNLDGTVNSISNKFWTDLDKFFEIAAKHEIYIMATMMSFDCTKAGNTDRNNWIAMIKNTNSINDFVDKYILKFVNRYKDNPYLFSMDLCNEPDWCFETDKIPWANLSNLFAREAAAIHENSKILVTVGLSMTKYNTDTQRGNKMSDAFFRNLYNNPNAYLDFYSPHHYAWETPWFKSPFFTTPAQWMSDTSKPIVVGECPAKSGEGHTLAEDFIWAYSKGYGGVFPWTTNGVDSNGGLADVTKGVTGFYAWLAAQ